MIKVKKDPKMEFICTGCGRGQTEATRSRIIIRVAGYETHNIALCNYCRRSLKEKLCKGDNND